MDITVKVIVSIVFGILLGIITIPISKKLTLSRTDDPAKAAPLNTVLMKVLFIILGLGASFAIVFTAGDYDILVRNLLVLIPIFSIALVDSLVRKIPNSLLLSIIIIDAVYLAYHCIANKSAKELASAGIGFVAGLIVSNLPSILKIPMGAGDIKYSAVIGLTIYMMGYFQSMILMGIFVAIFLAYLKISKKGDLKTLVPMGPFLSLGTVVTMCVSIVDLVNLNLV
jgi:prepilin signal peptidase PulO-like enzyme (type II secretory pathway)